MSEQEQKVVVPDIGSDEAVEVIEINVKVGDAVEVEDTLITLESEKASMEIPSPVAGVVTSIDVKLGDKVNTGSQIVTLNLAGGTADASAESNIKDTFIESVESVGSDVSAVELSTTEPSVQEFEQISSTDSSPSLSVSKEIEVSIPDIGTDDKVDVIEINVKPGDTVSAEDPLITLESEKASMEIPAPSDGTVGKVLVQVGDKVGFGDLVLYLTTSVNTINSDKSASSVSDDSAAESSSTHTSILKPATAQSINQSTNLPTASTNTKELNNIATSNKNIYASPSVRRFANDLGVDLSKVVGKGRKNRVLKQDVEHYVKDNLAKIQSGAALGTSPGSSGSGLGLEIASLPEVDFSKFGEVTEKPLKRIQKLSASNLHRNWIVVPHVTQFDEADITEMEEFRQKYKKQAQEHGYKLTPLVFLLRAAAQALKLLPQFNVSLSNDGQSIIQKHYYHIGIAVDTPNGLVVPVVRDVDQKGLFQLAKELGEISQKARDGKLKAVDMQGSCFSISSLGGIGGTAFTPIVNVPDVAIMGVSKSQIKPVYQNGEFVPRLMLPLSLSYDHRAIDGADAARFITIYSSLLSDISQLLL